jgi:hypothetical protein
MPGPVPGIHVLQTDKTWMAGTSPAMTNELVERETEQTYVIPAQAGIQRRVQRVT